MPTTATADESQAKHATPAFYITIMTVMTAFSMYYCSFLYVLTRVTHVTTHVTVCVI